MRPAPRSRKRKKRSTFSEKAAIISAGVAAGAVILGVSGYLYYVNVGKRYQTVFFPNTSVNGLDVSYKTAEEAEAIVASRMDDYVLTITGRGGVTEQITGEEAGFHYLFDGTMASYLAAQDPMDWWSHRRQATEYQIDTMIEADDEKLSARIEQLVFLDDSQMTEPQDAYLTEFVPGQGYRVVPEVEGTVLDKEAVREAVKEAVHNKKTELSLEELGVYKEPAVTSDYPEIQEKIAEQEHYLGVVVTYQFGDEQEILDRDTTVQWIYLNEEGRVALDEEKAAAYVKELADRYDTVGKTRTLDTTYGETVTIEKGNYGWKIDQAEETKELCAVLESGVSQNREPVYSQKAVSREERDYGNTYVEVNLTAQHLYFYKDGELVVDSDFVSGSHAKGHDTPAGSYFLNYKKRNTVLRGARRADGSYEYQSYVKYWMPFNNGIGLHDASWRSSFGGKIYLKNGSHGCVNLPRSAAEKIYENINAGDPILCYHLEGTSGAAKIEETDGTDKTSDASKTDKTTGTSSGSSGSGSASKPAATKPAASAQPQATQPAQPQVTEPTQPQVIEPAQSQTVQPVQPQVTQPQVTPPAADGTVSGGAAAPNAGAPVTPDAGGASVTPDAGAAGGLLPPVSEAVTPNPDSESQAPAGPGQGSVMGPGSVGGNAAGMGSSDPGAALPGNAGTSGATGQSGLPVNPDRVSGPGVVEPAGEAAGPGGLPGNPNAPG